MNRTRDYWFEIVMGLVLIALFVIGVVLVGEVDYPEGSPVSPALIVAPDSADFPRVGVESGATLPTETS